MLLQFDVFNRTSNYTAANTTGYDATWNSNTKSGVVYPVAGLGIPTADGAFPDGTTARRARPVCGLNSKAPVQALGRP